MSHQGGYLQRLAGYYLEVLERMRSASNSFLINITQGRTHEYVDLSLFSTSEPLLKEENMEFRVSPSVRPISVEQSIILEKIPTTDNQEIFNERDAVFQHLRELHQKYVINPFERRFSYAYPFLVGQTQNGTKICAPLFFVKCHLEHDLSSGKLVIQLTSDELEFNSYVLKEILGEGKFQYLEKTILTKRYPLLPLNEDAFTEFLNHLVNATDALLPVTNWNWELERLAVKPVSYLPGNKFQIKPFAALILGGIPQYYLRDNLEKLKSLSDDTEQSVLSAIFSKETDSPSDNFSDDRPIELEDFIFPFENNQSQRNVAQAIEHHKLVCVQGPPGTGKSQTIANLVCHLVASGKTVLVTSQKNKALEVVSKKLSKLDIEYLFMDMLKDDIKSKRELLQSLGMIDASLDIFTQSSSSLNQNLQQMEQKIGQYKGTFEELRRKFNQARQYESKQEQLYRRYYETREDDIFFEDTILPEIESKILTDDMYKYARAYIEGGAGFERDSWRRVLNSWTKKLPQIISQPEIVVKIVNEIGSGMKEIASLIQQQRVIDITEQILKDETFPTSHIDKLLPTLEQSCTIATEYFRQEKIIQRQFSDTDKLIENARRIGLSGNVLLQEVIMDFNGLCKCIEIIFNNTTAKWFQPFRILRRTFAKIKLNTILKQLPEELNSNHLSELVKSKNFAAWQKEKKKLQTLLQLSKLENQLNAILDKQIFPLLNREELLQKNISEIENIFNSTAGALNLITLNEEVKNLSLSIPTIAEAYGLMKLLNENNPTALNDTASTLERLAKSLPYFSRLKQLEECLGESVTGWIRDYCEQERIEINQELWDIFYRAIESYRLRKLVEQDMRENADDTHIIGIQIREKREKFTQTIKKLLKLKIDKHLKTEYTSAVAREIVKLKKALQKGKKKFASFEQLKEQIDFKLILKIFPCWIITIDDICRIFPLEQGLFDVIIVDEASQCHLMGALPLLFRAKRAVIVGDEKQLPNADVMFLDSAINAEKKRKFGIESLPNGFPFDAREYSLLDLADSRKDCLPSPFLNEHFRSVPEIIHFCNKRFYAEKLRIMTHSLDVPPDGVFEIIKVENALDDNDKINRKEAEMLIEDLIRRMKDPRYDGLSFGVLSLFREQASYLEKLLQERLLDHPELLNRSTSEPLICSTVDGFQGDERDVIFYSFRYAENSHPGVIHAIQQDKRGECRINVAFSRARKKVICYISRDISDFPSGLIRDFLTYVKTPSAGTSVQDKVFDSDFEEDVCKRLEKKGLYVIPQYPICGFSADLMVQDSKGRRIIVECDGMQHYDEFGELLIEDLIRQEILERAKWYVMRIPSRRYWHDPDKCINEIVAKLEEMPQRIDTEIIKKLSTEKRKSRKNDLGNEKKT